MSVNTRHRISAFLLGLLAACAAMPEEEGGDTQSSIAKTEPTNPIGRGADPGVLQVGDQYVMVTTSGSASGAMPLRASTDLVTWRDVGPVLPKEKWPSWAKGDFWAPEIHRVRDCHVAFFTARSKTTDKPSVGIAWTKDLDRWAHGDIEWNAVVWSTAAAPLVSDPVSGMIDPSFIEDGGTPYLFWKRDLWTNEPDGVWRHESELYAQELAFTDAAPLLTLLKERTTVLTITEPWESDVIEAPFVVKKDGYFHILYSANRYWEGKYVVSDARSKNVLGPYEKLGFPILKSDAEWKGPGHGSLVSKDGRDWFVYHAYRAGEVGDKFPRLLMLDAVSWKDGWPLVGDGTPSTMR